MIGTIGQANYAAGNTYQDGLARYRQQIGQKAISLDLGWMGDIGILAENEDLSRRANSGKDLADLADLAKISEPEFHALLEHFCDPNVIIPQSLPLVAPQSQLVLGLLAPAHFRAKGHNPPPWAQTKTFSPLAQIKLEQGSPFSASPTTDDQRDYAAEFVRAESPADVILDGLITKLAHALSIPRSEIDASNPLHTYGVDSLLAVELRSWFAKIFAADVAVFEISGRGDSIAAVARLVAVKSSLARKEVSGRIVGE